MWANERLPEPAVDEEQRRLGPVPPQRDQQRDRSHASSGCCALTPDIRRDTGHGGASARVREPHSERVAQPGLQLRHR